MKLNIIGLLLVICPFIAFAQDNRVGINIDTPREALDINGDLKVEHPKRTSLDKIKQLKIGDDKVIGKAPIEESTQAIYKYQLLIDTKKDNKQFQNITYGTNDLVNKWYLFCTRAELYDRNFGQSGKEIRIEAPAVMSHAPVRYEENYANPFPIVEVYEKEGLWWIKAAYVNAVAYNSGGYNNGNNKYWYGGNENVYQWRLDMVAIKKSFIKEVNVPLITLSSEKGTADISPLP